VNERILVAGSIAFLAAAVIYHSCGERYELGEWPEASMMRIRMDRRTGEACLLVVGELGPRRPGDDEIGLCP